MTRARAAWIAPFALLACLLGAAVAGGAWIFYTSPGLEWLAARAVGLSGQRLEIRGVSGTLAVGARARLVALTTEDLSVRVHEARFSLSPRALLELSVDLPDLGAARVEVAMRPGGPPGSLPPASIGLPVQIAIRNARVGTLVFDDATRHLELHQIHLEYAGGARRHEVKALEFLLSGQAFALRARVDAQKPFTLEAGLAVVRFVAPEATVEARVTGDASQLQIDARARSAGASANAGATIRLADPQPIVALRAHVRDLDPRTIDASLPHAGIDAELALARKDDRLQGAVSIRNVLPGPVNRQRMPLASLRAQILASLAEIDLSHVHADLGAAGVVTGTGHVKGEEAALDLAIKGLDLRAVYSTLRQTQLAGAAKLRLSASRQSVSAGLRQDDIRFALDAERAGDEVTISRLEATAKGGRAQAHGRLNLSARKPFLLQAQLSDFDPSAWGDYPRGAISASLHAQGLAQDPSARVEFAIRDSRWLGAPLSGKGIAKGSMQRLAQVDVALFLGANRLTAKGAFGGKADSLAVRIDAPELGLIGRQVRGQVHGAAVLSGTFQAPSVRLDVSAADLGLIGTGSIDRAQIRARASLAPDMPLELRAALTGVTTPQVRLQSVQAHIEGSRLRHEASLDAVGKPVELRLRLRGALSADNVWTGTLLELVNRGEAALELVRPVALTVAPAAVHVEPFELRAMGGRLIVDALAYDKERLRTAGSVQALPVVRLIELVDRQAAVKGTLRVSGRWDLDTMPRLHASVSIARDSGTLRLGTIDPVDLGVRALAASADIDPARIEFQANAELALARAFASGRIRAADNAETIPYTAASALDFMAQVDVARFAPFADFIDTAMILRGEAQARLQGGGTLGDPQITGQVRVANAGIVMPAEGVNLTDGALIASVTPQSIRIESLSIRGGEGVLTAQGTLARGRSDQASIDWRAQRFTALGRPDRKLVVSGQGNAALHDKRVSMTGRLQVVEGKFEIGQSAMPTLSSDVVVVGRERSSDEAHKRSFQNLALDLSVDLADRMHVLGHGLSVWLAGELRLFTDQNGRIRANGTVRTRDGSFEAYGQRLAIERGSIYFNGPLDNPGLDIVAMRRRQAVEAGVALSGTLQSPLVRVVSDPPLPQGEALSWLVLGRSASDAGPGELSALPLASSLLLGKATSPLKSALKLDEIGLSGGAAGEQLLTLGKRLTDRLYVVFEQSFSTTETLLRLEYTLTRRIVLRLQAGKPSGGGIFYRKRWD